MKNIIYFIKGLGIIFIDTVIDLFSGFFGEQFKSLIKDIVETGKRGEKND